jgi:hypothetical protein
LEETLKKSLFIAFWIFLLASSSYAKYSGGTGEPNNPFQIATPNDLNEIGNHPNDWNDCYILTADINMADYTYTTALIAPDADNSGYPFDDIPFTGVFDGNNHIIKNLSIDTAGAWNDHLGLFGKISGGTMCGENTGTISGCYSTGIVIGGDHIGGLSGENNGTISGCYATVEVDAHMGVGGLVGYNAGAVNYSYVTYGVEGGWFVGGLVGYNIGAISHSYATGLVVAHGGRLSFPAGGLVGLNEYVYGQDYHGTIINCYATGDVTGYSPCSNINAGGLCGKNYEGTISNSYSTGEITECGEVDGGFCAINSGGTITNCFWDVETSGMSDSDGGTPKTTAEMQTQSTFTNADWDFVCETINGPNDIWEIPIWNGQLDYPRLVWQQMPTVDMVCPNGVDFLDYGFFANNWMFTDCNDTNDCNSTDLDFSGDVGPNDVNIFINHWLFGK